MKRFFALFIIGFFHAFLYTIAGIPDIQPIHSTIAIPNVGTTRIASNGDYTFTAITGFTGAVPAISHIMMTQ